MSANPNGRVVAVRTKFGLEAVRAGGVDRATAVKASEQTMLSVRDRVQSEIEAVAIPLAQILRAWPPEEADATMQARRWSAAVRDLGGLANQHLLTEVAMHVHDCLDVILAEGASMDRVEACCFADALDFSRQDLCRGTDLAPYRPLLVDLERLTTLVINRNRADQ